MLLWLISLLTVFVAVQSINRPPEAFFYGIDKAIPEDTPIGTIVFFVNASDPDGPASDLRLKLESNSFHLLPNGSVQLVQRLNYELETEASFSLTVSDSTSSTPYSKIIQVSDVNDVNPRFSEPRYQTHLAENTPVGTLVFDVTVNDADINNKVLSVECVNNPASATACDTFLVNTTTATNRFWAGKIYLKKELDYESGTKLYQLLLQAKDGNDDHYSIMTFEITVDDVPDSPPFFEGSFNQVINEDVPPGTFVITVIARDRDTESRPIRYELTYNPGGFFAIDAESGNITTVKQLDREAQGNQDGIVSLTVTAREVLANGSLGNDMYTRSSANVTITIIDVNDNPPRFEQTHYSVNVSEALQNGQALPGLLMSVSDADGGNNAFFKFVFTGLKDYEDVFEVSPPEAQGSATATLLVKNSSALDYDRGRRSYTLEVVAREVRTAAPLSSTAVVTVYLMDANDNKPEFNVSKVDIDDLSELTKPGEEITSIPRATDIDTGNYGTAGIRYSLIGSGNNRFVLDSTSAVLRLANCTKPGTGNCLDHEAVTQYNLFIVATDNNGQGHETRLPLNIKIKDENDNLPEFTSNIYQYRVVEETTLLTTDQPINATDKDSSRNGNNRIRYSLVTDRESLFAIDEVTGRLRLKRPIQFTDGNENGRIRVTVSAGNKLDDSDVVDFTRTAIVDVYVEDINNNAPEFPRNYTATIQENILPGIEIIRVKAEDKDYGQNAALEYSIVSGSEDTFQIDSVTGVISRKHGAVINYETISIYNLTVRATDKGNPRLSGDTKVVINVIDDSNRNPIFSPPTRYANVSEDEAVDFLVISMQAIDIDDNANLQYSFAEPITAYSLQGQLVDVYQYDYRDLFRINEKTGEVRVNKKLDITKVQKIIYTVKAVDLSAEGPEESGTGTLTIDIINANNHAPEFIVVSGENNVYEEELPGSLVMVVSAKDADRNLVSFEMLNQSLSGALSIDEYTGIVTVADRIDYESVQVLEFTVRASDDTPPIKYTDRKFTVNVININDNVPVFDKPYYEAEIEENNTDSQAVVTVRATDLDLPDYGEVKYRLPEIVSDFRVDEVSGVIYKKPGVVFDREQLKEIQIPVEAYDGPGTPSRSSFVPVYIKIKDINDNNPFFLEDDVYIVLSNDHPIGSFVLRQTALDRDPDDAITYSITNDPEGRYSISPEGVVTTRKPLTTAPDHVFDIRATDKASHSAILHVHVTIVGNKKGPEWIFPAFEGDKIVVCENREAGFQMDPPVKAERAIEYSFYINNRRTSDLSDKFRINEKTGVITALRSLDREEQEKYLVQVLARDENGLESRRYLLIEVCDRDDNQPEFPTYPNGTVKSFFFTIEEDVIECVRDPLRNNQCGRVLATDLDLPENGQIVYSLSGNGNEFFTIDELTGVISTKRGLDMDLKEFYILTVTAHNYKIVNGQRIVAPNPTSKGTAVVFIQVLPRTDRPNTYINKEVNMYASIDTQIGQCLDTMRPRGLNANVQYSIQTQQLYNGNNRESEASGGDRFSIGKENGYICTINMFNPANGGFNYKINVKVTTDNGETDTGTANVWLTENKHKLRFVIDGDTKYVNEHREEILTSLKNLLGTNIVWIDSVGYHTNSSGYVNKTRSDIIVYAVNESNRQLLVRNESTITIIREKIITTHVNIAAKGRIIGIEDINTSYIYLNTGKSSALVAGGGGFPIGLLVAMILLLPLLLLPFLLACCLCCPCCAGLLGGGKKTKYALVEAPGYQQTTFIDDWYEQSRLYNNPAYVDYDENWDTGSDHMLVMNVDQKKAAAAGGLAGAANGQTFEETEEFYNHTSNGGINGARAYSNGTLASRTGQGEAKVMTSSQYNTLKSSGTAETAVIVDTLTPATAPATEETTLVEERHESRRQEESSSGMRKGGYMGPLGSLNTTEQHQHSSLSPATIDVLDSASSYNAHMANRYGTLNSNASGQHTGHFSHTAVVNRHGNEALRPSREEYYSSESYESDQHSNQRPSRYRRSSTRHEEDNGSMTIILDADRTPGMDVEEAEYELVTGEERPIREYVKVSTSGTIPRDGNGTIPRGGFTIELEPHSNGRDEIEADREEYVLTDDDGLAPEFYAQAQRSPSSSRRRYRKTTTQTYRD